MIQELNEEMRNFEQIYQRVTERVEQLQTIVEEFDDHQHTYAAPPTLINRQQQIHARPQMNSCIQWQPSIFTPFQQSNTLPKTPIFCAMPFSTSFTRDYVLSQSVPLNRRNRTLPADSYDWCAASEYDVEYVPHIIGSSSHSTSPRNGKKRFLQFPPNSEPKTTLSSFTKSLAHGLRRSLTLNRRRHDAKVTPENTIDSDKIVSSDDRNNTCKRCSLPAKRRSKKFVTEKKSTRISEERQMKSTFKSTYKRFSDVLIPDMITTETIPSISSTSDKSVDVDSTYSLDSDGYYTSMQADSFRPYTYSGSQRRRSVKGESVDASRILSSTQKSNLIVRKMETNTSKEDCEEPTDAEIDIWLCHKFNEEMRLKESQI